MTEPTVEERLEARRAMWERNGYHERETELRDALVLIREQAKEIERLRAEVAKEIAAQQDVADWSHRQGEQRGYEEATREAMERERTRE